MSNAYLLSLSCRYVYTAFAELVSGTVSEFGVS